MTEETKAKIGSFLLASAILTGCGKVDVQSNEKNEIYVQPSEEYTEVVEHAVITEMERVFEPYTHQITYQKPYYDSPVDSKYDYNGFINLQAPSIPGYKVEDYEPVTIYSRDGSRTIGYLFFYINTEKVLAKGYYDYDANELVFTEPGEVVEEEKKLVLK